MSFFGDKHQAPAAPPVGFPVVMPVPVVWPGLCAPSACDSEMAAGAGPGSLLPMPMPLSSCSEDFCEGAPCRTAACAATAQDARNVHPEACEANPMVLYGDFHKQDLGGEIHDMRVEKDLMQAERRGLEAIEENTEKSWGHLEKMLQSQTSDPMEHDHSLVLMVMSRKSTQHCVQTFKDMTLRNPMPHESSDNRLFRVIKTYATEDQLAKKYEIADVLYYDLRDEFVQKTDWAKTMAEEENIEKRLHAKIKENSLLYPRELQKHGAEWILIRSSYMNTVLIMKDMYHTECHQVQFNKSYYTLCRLYEEPMAWPESQYEPGESQAEYETSQPLENGEPKFFDSYESQKKLLRELFYDENSKYKDSYGYSSEPYDMLDVRDYLLKHPDWRAGYHDLMCANVHYGQYKLLERSIFLILFAAYKYKKKQLEEEDEDLSIDDVLKRLTCVYLGGGTPTPGKEDQHFPLLLKLIPHFLLVSYDVHKPDIGGAFDKKHRFEPEYEVPDAQASDDSTSTNRNRLLLIQKMCDYAEVEKIRDTMKATAETTTDENTGKTTGKRFYVVIQDIRTDVSLILCELESYRIVIKRLVYAVRQDQENPEFLGAEKRKKFVQDIRTTLGQKQALRKQMQELVQKDNICQMIFANVFLEAPNCMAVSAKWTFQYPDSRNDTSMAYCPDGMTNHQSFLGASTEHTAIMTTSIHIHGKPFISAKSGNTTMWGKTQQEGQWTDLKVGLIDEGRFITNQYELVVPNSLKLDYRNLCGKIRKNSIDGLIAYLQLKDPREEHIGAGTKFMVLHMYAQLCNDLQAKRPHQTPAFLWQRMQHAQAQALRKKTHALQHAWYFSRDIDNTLTMPITPEEFENVPNADIETFVQEISNYKVSQKMEAEKKKCIDAGDCLRQYIEHLNQGSSIWDFTEEGYIAAITLSLQSGVEIQKILGECQETKQKQALGQMLMRLCDQYHVMEKANIERLPVLKNELLKVVDSLQYWPGFGLETTDPRLLEYAMNQGMRTRDVYCNLFLPVILTEALRPLLQKVHFSALYNGIKAYLKLHKSGLLLWPMAKEKTKKFHDYPSNKSYLELAMQHDIVPLLQLMFKKVVNEELVPQTRDECSDILEKEFKKKNDDYTYPLNIAAYYGSARAVGYWVELCRNYNATNIIAQKHKYGNERLTSLEIARSRLKDVNSSKPANDHPTNAATKYAAIIKILTRYWDTHAGPGRLPGTETKPGARQRAARGSRTWPANSAPPQRGAGRRHWESEVTQDMSQSQAPATPPSSEVPVKPSSGMELQKPFADQTGSASAPDV